MVSSLKKKKLVVIIIYLKFVSIINYNTLHFYKFSDFITHISLKIDKIIIVIC